MAHGSSFMLLHPSFFKILLDPSRHHMPLPHDFVRKHLKNKKILENQIIVLHSVSGEFSWRLKINKVDETYSFADGWKKVVEDTGLVFGDFLVFWLVDHSTYKVLIFGTNGCPKVLPSKIKLEHEEEQEQENDDDDDDEDVVVVVVVNVNDDEEEDDDDDEEEEEDEDDDDDDDDAADVDDVNDEKDPFFVVTISKCHNCSLRFPKKFAQLAGLDRERMIRMKNLQGKEWILGLQSETAHYKRYYLSSGWSAFRKVNQLCEGDECVFKFIRSEDKLSLAKLTKKRAPVAEVMKRPRGRPSHVEVVKRPPKNDKNPFGEVGRLWS